MRTSGLVHSSDKERVFVHGPGLLSRPPVIRPTGSRVAFSAPHVSPRGNARPKREAIVQEARRTSS